MALVALPEGILVPFRPNRGDLLPRVWSYLYVCGARGLPATCRALREIDLKKFAVRNTVRTLHARCRRQRGAHVSPPSLGTQEKNQMKLCYAALGGADADAALDEAVDTCIDVGLLPALTLSPHSNPGLVDKL